MSNKLKIHYDKYFRKSWPYIKSLKEKIIVIRADRNIGKTTLLMDIAKETLNENNNVIFCKINMEVSKVFNDDFNSVFAGDYLINSRGFINKIEHKFLEVNGKVENVEVVNKTKLGCSVGWETLHRIRSQMSIQRTKYVIFDEYNLKQFKPKNFWEEFFQFFWTIVRESPVFEKVIFIGNRDGDINNDVENAFGLNFDADNNKEEQIIVDVGADDVNKDLYPELYNEFKVLLKNKRHSIIRGINCGRFHIKGSKTNKLLGMLSLMSINTANYFTGRTMYKRPRILVNFMKEKIFNLWKMYCVIAVNQELIGVGIVEDSMFCGIVYDERLIPKDIPRISLCASDCNRGKEVHPADVREVINVLIGYHKQQRLFFAENWSFTEISIIMNMTIKGLPLICI